MFKLIMRSAAIAAKPFAASGARASSPLRAGCRSFTSQVSSSASSTHPTTQNSNNSFKSFKEYRDFANKSGNMASVEDHCVIDTAREGVHLDHWKLFNEAAKKNDYNLE